MGPTRDRSESVENPESYRADLKACQQACAETLTLRTTSSFFPRPPILSSPRLPTAAAALSAGLRGAPSPLQKKKGVVGGATAAAPSLVHPLILQTPAPLAPQPPERRTPFSLPFCFILHSFSSHPGDTFLLPMASGCHDLFATFHANSLFVPFADQREETEKPRVRAG